MKIILSSLFALGFLLFMASSCCKVSDPELECVEDIKEDCACTMEYDPVCGCNEKTYSNACAAECAGIVDYTPGACE